MAIEKITSEELLKNIKVFSAGPVEYGGVIFNQMVDEYFIDLRSPKGFAKFYYLLPLNPTGQAKFGTAHGIFGTITTTTEWLIALIQEVINLDLAKSKLPLIPITGEFDCATQQAMVMETGGARNVDPNTLDMKVADLGPLEFGYLLSQRLNATSPTLSQMIIDASFGKDPAIGIVFNDINDFTGEYAVVVPIGKEGDLGYLPLKFIGAKADPKCVDWKPTPVAEDKKDGIDKVKEDETTPPAKKEEKSYFWPIVGGLAVGGVVIGGGYYLMKGDKKASTSS